MTAHDSDKRDAVISFQCSKPDLVQVSEWSDTVSVMHPEVRCHPGVVAEVESRYIFFAKHADVARREIMRGHSCEFNVYFREP
jgi:hypothetical protein